MAICKFCNTEIMWVKEGRKNVPINTDASKHTCKEMQNSLNSYKQIERDNLSQEEIAKYEKAMNEKPKK